MELPTGPKKPPRQAVKPASTSKEPDESLEDGEVAPRDPKVILPPPAPSLAQAIELQTATAGQTEGLQRQDVKEEIGPGVDLCPMGHTLEPGSIHIYTSNWLADQGMSAGWGLQRQEDKHAKETGFHLFRWNATKQRFDRIIIPKKINDIDTVIWFLQKLEIPEASWPAELRD